MEKHVQTTVRFKFKALDNPSSERRPIMEIPVFQKHQYIQALHKRSPSWFRSPWLCAISTNTDGTARMGGQKFLST